MRVGDTIIIRESGSVCTRFEDFAIKHNLTKFVEEYDPDPQPDYDDRENNNYIMDIPIRGRIVVIDNAYIGIDIGKHHIIMYSEGEHFNYNEIIPPAQLDDNLFTL